MTDYYCTKLICFQEIHINISVCSILERYIPLIVTNTSTGLRSSLILDHLPMVALDTCEQPLEITSIFSLNSRWNVVKTLVDITKQLEWTSVAVIVDRATGELTYVLVICHY